MKALLLTLIFIVPFLASSQKKSITGQVISISNEQLSGVRIINIYGSDLCEVTDTEGRFSFKAEKGMRFGAELEGYELQWSVVSDANDYTIKMETKVQEIESIVITRQSSEEALDIKNVNIIDYMPVSDYILTIKKKKGAYYFGFDRFQEEGPTYLLSIDKPKELFSDCMNNAYIISQDSAYQFMLSEDGLEIVSVSSIVDFDTYIRPCVSKFGERLVLERLKDLNQTYELTIYGDSSRHVLSIQDGLGYQAAWEAAVRVGKTQDPNTLDPLMSPEMYQDRKRRVMYGRNDTGKDFYKDLQAQNLAAMEESANAQLTHTANNGEAEMLSSGDTEYFGGEDVWRVNEGTSKDMASYILYTRPIDVRTFQIKDYMFVVDFLQDSILLFDHNGYKLKSTPFHVDSDIKDVMQDEATGYLYLYTRDHGNGKIFGLNALTGETEYLKNFRGMSGAEQILIHNNFLYYRILENDFFEVNRVRLPAMSFYD